MYPTRILWPKVGEEVVFWDVEHHLVLLHNCENKTEPVLSKYEIFTIKTLVPSTGTTFAEFLEVHGLHDLCSFVRGNDIWLRKHKLEILHDKARNRGIRKVF